MWRRRVDHGAQSVGNRDIEHGVDDMPIRIFPLASLKVIPSRCPNRGCKNLLDHESFQIAGHNPLSVGIVPEFLAARDGSLSFISRSTVLPSVASRHASESSNRFQSANVNVKLVVLV